MNINEYVDWTNFISPIFYILLQSGWNPHNLSKVVFEGIYF